MPLDNGYGVVVGKVKHHYIEPPNAQGQWPHYVIIVETPAGDYECVVNLKSRTEVKIEYRTFMNVSRQYFSSILNLSNGFHPLPSTSGSGALDFIRHQGLQDPLCKLTNIIIKPIPDLIKRRPEFKNYLPELEHHFPGLRPKKIRCSCTQWWKENGLNVVKLMEYYLENVERIYIFGEPYTNGLGVHNVHMNQGDPVGSSFADEKCDLARRWNPV